MRALLFLPTGRHDQTGPVFGDEALHMPTPPCVALIKREELRGVVLIRLTTGMCAGAQMCLVSIF